MSKLNIFMGLFVSLLVASSCDKVDEAIAIDGTYKVSSAKQDGVKSDGSGTFVIKKESGDDYNYKLSVQSLTLGNLSKGITFDLFGKVTEIDSKAFQVEVKKQTVDRTVPFGFSYKLNDVAKLLIGVSVDEIEFLSDSEKMTFKVVFQPASVQKVSYDGKKYTGVIQQDQAELALNIDALYTATTIDSDKLVESIQNNDVKKAVKKILTGDDVAKKLAIQKLIDDNIKLFKGGNQVKADWTITLKKQ